MLKLTTFYRISYNKTIQTIMEVLLCQLWSQKKKDIEALGTAGKEEILQYLEEVFISGSFATEVTNKVKENSFFKGESITESKDISVNPAERLLLILHSIGGMRY